MDGKLDFAKDVRIQIRSSPYQLKSIKARAEELGLSMSEYIRLLIKEDLKERKRDGVINKHNPF